jgi:hypothetical protein
MNRRIKKYYDEAGDLRGLDLGGAIRSMLDAGLHLGDNLEAAKEVTLAFYQKHYGPEGWDQPDLMDKVKTIISGAIITPLGIGTV